MRSTDRLERQAKSTRRKRPSPPPMRSVRVQTPVAKSPVSAATSAKLNEAVKGLSATKIDQVVAFAEFLNGKKIRDDDDLSLLTTGFDLIQGGAYGLQRQKPLKPYVLAGVGLLVVALGAGVGIGWLASSAPSETVTMAVTPEPAQPQFATYTVRSGDSLSGIANTVFGDPHAWPRLQHLNYDRIPDATHLEVGTVLRVPHLPLASASRNTAPAKPGTYHRQ